MDHPLSPRLFGPGVVLASLLSLFSTSVPAQTLSGLTARQSGTSIVLELATVSSVDIGALNFFYSEDGGSHWQSIDPDCLTLASSRSVEWAVLECLDVDAFTGDNIRFKATSSSCTGTVRFDGYDYRIVEIGSQCWFAENLRSEHYANGHKIPDHLRSSEWIAVNQGAQSVYKNKAKKLATYGRLYNWYAVKDSRGLCPRGWHVPTDSEWIVLTDGLGGSLVAGNEMKSSLYDSPSWDGTNDSGFAALPGGWRGSSYGYFNNGKDTGYWWSGSPDGRLDAWCWGLFSDDDDVGRSSFSQRAGFSVRCLRDE